MRCASESPLRIRARLHVPASLLVASTLVLVSCQDDEPDCERCDFTFFWDSEGRFSASEEDCREIDCAYALCGVCYDITYNEANQPTSGTCDNCVVEPSCGAGKQYCPTHPDECSVEDREAGTCGCVDTRSDGAHCGRCFNVCTEGTYCSAGVCVTP